MTWMYFYFFIMKIFMFQNRQDGESIGPSERLFWQLGKTFTYVKPKYWKNVRGMGNPPILPSIHNLVFLFL
jgi:hypothetical protein